MNLADIDLYTMLSVVGPAFLAGLLVLSTHVPLGQEVLKRGIVFIDLAIAQVAGVGVIAAHILGWEPHGWAVQVAAVGAALLGALLLTWTERRWPDSQEALIGSLFVIAASGGVLLLAGDPLAGEHLQDILVGQILWVTPTALVPVAAVYAAVLGLWFGLAGRLGAAGFYLLFAVSVTASVQLVGVYLVFASLILPGLASRRYPERLRLLLGYGVGAAGYAVGLSLSAVFDLPTGAVVVLTLALIAALAAVLSPASSTGLAETPLKTGSERRV